MGGEGGSIEESVLGGSQFKFKVGDFDRDAAQRVSGYDSSNERKFRQKYEIPRGTTEVLSTIEEELSESEAEEEEEDSDKEGIEEGEDDKME